MAKEAVAASLALQSSTLFEIVALLCAIKQSEEAHKFHDNTEKKITACPLTKYFAVSFDESHCLHDEWSEDYQNSKIPTHDADV